jgi:hypothetical protein
MEAKSTSETSVNFHHVTQRNMAEYGRIHCSGNVASEQVNCKPVEVRALIKAAKLGVTVPLLSCE